MLECKVLFSISCISDLFVEIDTLWNVKQYQGTPRHSLACRNRYIVECKVLNERSREAVSYRRNRYIVECKDWSSKYYYKFRGVEIDTLWNVKRESKACFCLSIRRNRYIVECKVICLTPSYLSTV